MSDFVNWEDLDLDELLGEYTDDDFYSDVSSISSSDVTTDVDGAGEVGGKSAAASSLSVVSGKLN
jgi:hypothetical protein